MVNDNFSLKKRIIGTNIVAKWDGAVFDAPVPEVMVQFIFPRGKRSNMMWQLETLLQL